MSTRRNPHGRRLVTPTITLLLVLLVLLPMGTASAEDPVDRHYWFGGNHYTVNDDALSFHEAEEFCADLSFGGHLVTINSEEENQFVFDLYPWGMLGATDEETEGDWRWVTGEPFDYTNWAPGEPNDCGGPGCPTEDFLVFAYDDGFIPEWNDVPGGMGGFVCEWEEPVVPYRVDDLTVTVGDTVQFGARWLSVCNRGLTRAFTHAAELSWTIDGVPIDLDGSWSDPFLMPDSGTEEPCIGRAPGMWGTLWEGSMTFDEPGTYEIGQVYSLSHKITDGADFDGDGKKSFYGPGILAESSVSVEVVDAIVPPAFLYVEHASPESVFVNQVFDFETVVTNGGPALATNVVLVDTLPDPGQMISSDPGGTLDTSGERPVLTVLLGDIPAGNSVNVTVTWQAPSEAGGNPGEMSSTVTVSGDNADAVSAGVGIEVYP